MAAALQEVLSVTEVALRNTIDERLRVWNSQQVQRGITFNKDWTAQAAAPLNSLTRDARKAARKHATEARDERPSHHARAGAPVTSDDVVAQLTFGLWPKLLPTQDTASPNYSGSKLLWQQALQAGFPHAVNDPKGIVLGSRARRLHGLRNRVAHMEPLFDVNIIARHTDALKVLGAISPAARDWCAGESRVRALYRECPVTLHHG